MILKVALNQLKIEYDEVKTPKLPRPCTLACICKIIWVSDSGQVGEWSSKFQNHTGREAYEKIMLNFIFWRESPVIENLDKKYSFKAVQKLSKRESGERWPHKRMICAS